MNAGNALVRYLRPGETRLLGLWRLLSKLDYDLLYLNGCFPKLTIRILLLRAMWLLKRKPTVLAPRGEFSPAALAIKHHRKWAYLKLSRYAGFYRGLVWHASNYCEANDIWRESPGFKRSAGIQASPIRIASYPFLQVEKISQRSENMRPRKEPGAVRIIFISRISRMKNLDYALHLLSCLSGNVQFDIYGPLEDLDYWNECQKIIKNLPPYIGVNYRGIARAEEVRNLFGRYHLFLFPTRGENFGHVIPEALSSGCLVLLSDQTPWRGLEQKGFGWDIALTDTRKFHLILEIVLAMDHHDYSRRSLAARSFIQEFIRRQNQEIRGAYERVFDILQFR